MSDSQPGRLRSVSGDDSATLARPPEPAEPARPTEESEEACDAPGVFSAAVAALTALQPRPELELGRLRAPQRLAPWSYAIAGEIPAAAPGSGDQAAPGADEVTVEAASGRLVLLHDPEGHEAWGGVLRVVVYLEAALERELAGDPMLASVGWSWLTDALASHGATFSALGGTVTQTSSARFGDIAGPEFTHDLQLRASWSPRDEEQGVREELALHGAAFCELLASAAGLPPEGTAALRGSGD